MQQYKGMLLCCDCDGTLTYEAGKVSKENADAILHFQQNGGLFTVATGRFPDFIKHFEDSVVPNAPMIAINGTMVFDWQSRTILWQQPFETRPQQVIDFVANHYDCVTQVRVVHSPGDPVFYNKGEGPTLQQVCADAPDPWYKLVFVAPELDCLRLQADLTQRFGQHYTFDRSWPNGLEMHAKGTGKGPCLPILKAHIQTPIHTTICVGDYENDISMLQAADVSFAVANAVDSVKQAATYVTVANTEHAIARIIERLPVR